MMDFRINTFLTVCKHMNFTKAAAALNMTQPAVSQHMHYLEELYEAKLFKYEGKKMFLTDAGEVMRLAATTMKHDDRYLRDLLRNSAGRKNRLAFGATLTIGEFVMARRLAAYLEMHPDAEVRMTQGNTRELLEMLGLGEIDFALVEGNFDRKGYDSLLFSQERYIPVCSHNYKFATEPKKLADLLSERIIIRERGSGTREILEKNLEARNLGVSDFRHTVEIGGMNAIKSLVECGCGITFLYEAAVEIELGKGVLREIKLEDFRIQHNFEFIWNKGSAFSDNYRELFNQLSPL